MYYVTLANGVRMSQLGYGVYQVTKEECERCVLDAQSSSFFSHQDPAMVEWFYKIVEERKHQHDCTKEKKNW